MSVETPQKQLNILNIVAFVTIPSFGTQPKKYTVQISALFQTHSLSNSHKEAALSKKMNPFLIFAIVFRLKI